jgi:hypothetical protein
MALLMTVATSACEQRGVLVTPIPVPSVAAASEAPSSGPVDDAGVDATPSAARPLTCKEERTPTMLAIVGDEVYAAGDAGTVVAIGTTTGRRRTVACGFDGIRDLAPASQSLLIVDAGGLWELSLDGQARRRIAEQPAGVVALGDRIAFGEWTDAGDVSVRTTSPADSGIGWRELARVTTPEEQATVVTTAGGALLVARTEHSPRGSDWEMVDLERVPLDGGRPVDLTWTDSVVAHAESDSHTVAWYTNGWRGSSWGGGYGTCELVVAPLSRGRMRTLRRFGPPPGDQCEARVWFVLDSDAVIYRSSEEDLLLRQPIAGGPAIRLATVPRDALGLVRDATTVYWLGADGSLGRAPSRVASGATP